MSAKLNAEELAAKMFPMPALPWGMAYKKTGRDVRQAEANACAKTIDLIAQPIADQRDELLEALKMYVQVDDQRYAYEELTRGVIRRLEDRTKRYQLARAAIAKATQP